MFHKDDIVVVIYLNSFHLFMEIFECIHNYVCKYLQQILSFSHFISLVHHSMRRMRKMLKKIIIELFVNLLIIYPALK